MKKILIVKFGALGDVVRTSYVLPPLLEKYPDLQIYWLTADSSFELLRYNPYIFKLATPSFGMDSIINNNFNLILSLDDEPYILDIVNSLRTKDVVGAYKTDDGSSYCDASKEWFDMGLISKYGSNEADRLKKMNQREHNQIFGDMLNICIYRPCFFNSPLIENRATKFFDQKYFNIGLNSGSGARWISKQLKIEETINLIKILTALTVNEKPIRIYLLGGKDEVLRHQTIMQSLDTDRIIDTGTDNSLLEFAAAVRCCDYLISSDSLALHLAIAQGVRNLSFYAPTSAAEIGTFGTGVKVLSLSADYCSYKKDADNSTITAMRIVKAFCLHMGIKQ